MKVSGSKVPEDAISAAVARMRAMSFRTRDLVDVLTNLKVPFCYTVAARLILRESRAGNIEQYAQKGRWRWKPAADALSQRGLHA